MDPPTAALSASYLALADLGADVCVELTPKLLLLARKTARAALGDGHPTTARLRLELAWATYANSRIPRALRRFRRARTALLRAGFGPDSHLVCQAQAGLALVHLYRLDGERMVASAARVLSSLERQVLPAPATFAAAEHLSNMAAGLRAQWMNAEAAQCLRATVDMFAAAGHANHSAARLAQFQLGVALALLPDGHLALPHLRAAVEWAVNSANLSPSSPDLRERVAALARFACAWDDAPSKALATSAARKMLAVKLPVTAVDPAVRRAAEEESARRRLVSVTLAAHNKTSQPGYDPRALAREASAVAEQYSRLMEPGTVDSLLALGTRLETRVAADAGGIDADMRALEEPLLRLLASVKEPSEVAADLLRVSLPLLRASSSEAVALQAARVGRLALGDHHIEVAEACHLAGVRVLIGGSAPEAAEKLLQVVANSSSLQQQTASPVLRNRACAAMTTLAGLKLQKPDGALRAKALLDRALQAFTAMGGHAHPTIEVHNQLANYYQHPSVNSERDALRHLQTAAQISADVRMPSAQTASIQLRIGAILHARGQWREAQGALGAALATPAATFASLTDMRMWHRINGSAADYEEGRIRWIDCAACLLQLENAANAGDRAKADAFVVTLRGMLAPASPEFAWLRQLGGSSRKHLDLGLARCRALAAETLACLLARLRKPAAEVRAVAEVAIEAAGGPLVQGDLYAKHELAGVPGAMRRLIAEYKG